MRLKERRQLLKIIRLVVDLLDGRFFVFDLDDNLDKALSDIVPILYKADMANRGVTITTLTRAMYCHHPATCRKVLDALEKDGYIKITDSEFDRRSKFVVPTAKLISAVEEKLAEIKDEISEFL